MRTKVDKGEGRSILADILGTSFMDDTKALSTASATIDLFDDYKMMNLCFSLT